MRSVSRTIAEIVRERFQAVRQRRLDVHPRVHRSWTFAGLRAFSNCLLRDLNTAVVSEEMMRGARSIYVDYVDYDEIAPPRRRDPDRVAGRARGLDQVVAILEKVAQRAPRRYHLVLLSDHGQSQGEPFALALRHRAQRPVPVADPLADDRGRGQHRGLGPGRLGAGGPGRDPHRRRAAGGLAPRRQGSSRRAPTPRRPS